MSEDIEQQLNVEEVLKSAANIETKEEPNQTDASSINVAQQQESKSTPESINKHHFDTYLNWFIHSIYCRSNNCTFNNCMQFKRILQHSKTCQKIKTNQCDLCRQIITLCIYHAKNCSDDTCHLPLCNSIKRKLRENEEIKQALQFITESIDALKSKINKETQVSDTMIAQKRKHCMMDNDEEIETVDSDEDKNNKIKENDLNMRKKLLMERFKQIEENPLESTKEKLTKNSRLELVKTFYQQCYSDFLKLETDNKCNANFVALLLRQEQYINKMTQSADDYLHLLAYYFYQVIRRLEMRKQFRSNGVQADLTSDEAEQNDINDGSNKRFKLE